MAAKTIGGINGVLQGLISAEDMPAVPLPAEMPPPESHTSATVVSSPQPPAPNSPRTRLGRPPRSGIRHSTPKEKVTLRIRSDLIAEYRDWSWESRCQISNLVERALLAYRNSRRRQ
jgi:hypothetical protein